MQQAWEIFTQRAEAASRSWRQRGTPILSLTRAICDATMHAFVQSPIETLLVVVVDSVFSLSTMAD